MKKYPLFIFLFAVYPGLALLTWNFREVDSPSVIVRPIIFSLVVALVFWLLAWGITRNWPKAALLATVLLIFFFSFGHIAFLIAGSDLMQRLENSDKWINILFPAIALLILAFLVMIILRTRMDLRQTYLTLNVISAFLVISSCVTVIYNYYTRRPASTTTKAEVAAPTGTRPDVYYIILDAYGRQDALESLGYDNSDFIRELRDLGFYVASCSRSNYPQTVVSMASSLNMGYLWDVLPNQGANDRNSQPVFASILHSQVRKEFEDLGYQVMAFDAGAGWLNWRDADQFFAPPPAPFFSTQLDPFEYIFLDTTALHSLLTRPFFLQNKYVQNYNRILFTLDELPKLAGLRKPKFVYVHMLIPHRPNIFLPDGSMNLDTDFYVKGVGEGINRQVDIEGYINNIEFINSRLPGILQGIIQQSATPPVIVIQGDHGYQLPDIRFENLNAYFFPDGNQTGLYPEITPVNTFRVIFNTYFGAEYPLLKDQSINVGVNRPYGKKIMKPAPCP